MSSGVVVVFGRQPEPGKVKTRLAAAIGDLAAAAVYEVILQRTLEAATASGLRVVFSTADSATFDWKLASGVELEHQSGGNLGRRMGDAFDRRFDEGEERVVVIGSDGPWLTPIHLQQAINHLDGADVVLGPAEDGGYWLVAQRAPGVKLFEGIPWSSPDTLDATRRRLEELGATWRELESLTDIDTIEDLDRVIEDPRTEEDLKARLRAAMNRELSS